jgi:hypothetical protein
MTSFEHFKGKTVPDHLKEARKKGAFASSEVHGAEISGFLGALSDSIRETALYLLILWAVLQNFPVSFTQLFTILLLFSGGLFLWKSGRSALLGWSRLERLHRLIEEERWEIEHHRAQERSELKELYQVKGFEGKLLEEVLDVLMADDNRLLRVMLEEELGLSLESYEHPLKQAAGAALGVFVPVCLIMGLFWMIPAYGVLLGSALSIIFSAALFAKHEKNRAIPAVIWNLATCALAYGVIYFLTSQFIS